MSARSLLVFLCGRANPIIARSGQVVWRDRRGRGGADRWAHPSGHFSASRRLGRAQYHGNVNAGRHDDDSSDAGDD
eukprot:4308945-Pyramimonas_sp.AAC.1